MTLHLHLSHLLGYAVSVGVVWVFENLRLGWNGTPGEGKCAAATALLWPIGAIAFVMSCVGEIIWWVGYGARRLSGGL